MTPTTLPLDKALELVPLADGVLRIGDLPMLSLPCVVESRSADGRPVIITHFERARDTYLEALRANPVVTLHFVTGHHYIDPSWIPRHPHAPTEVKAVFEISGTARLIDRPAAETLSMMHQLTRARQALYSPGSDWQIDSLPADYTDRLFPMIAEVEIEPAHYHLSRLMVLEHLSPAHRQSILDRLQAADSPCARAALRLFEIACR